MKFVEIFVKFVEIFENSLFFVERWKSDDDASAQHELHLVPLTDLINCRQLHDPSAVHQTTLERIDESSLAVTRTNDAFKFVRFILLVMFM